MPVRLALTEAMPAHRMTHAEGQFSRTMITSEGVVRGAHCNALSAASLPEKSCRMAHKLTVTANCHINEMKQVKRPLLWCGPGQSTASGLGSRWRRFIGKFWRVGTIYFTP